MIRKIALALFACLVAAPAFAAGEPELAPPTVLKTNVMVEGETILLGDLFDVTGAAASTVVAYAPQPGRRAIFDANWLARLAQRHGLNWRPKSRYDRVVLERLSTTITGTEIEDELRRELARRGYGDDMEIALSSGGVRLDIPVDQPPSIAITNMSIDERSQRFTATVAAPAGDPRARRIKVAGRIYKIMLVPVPNRNLMPGDVITAEDLNWVRVRAAQVRDTTASEARQLIGTEPRRPLRANRPVRMTDVREPLLIHKGDFVTMVYVTAAMRLTATGRAMSNGSKGDLIQVLNTNSNMIIEAIADGTNRVLVVVAGRLATN